MVNRFFTPDAFVSPNFVQIAVGVVLLWVVLPQVGLDAPSAPVVSHQSELIQFVRRKRLIKSTAVGKRANISSIRFNQIIANKLEVRG